MRRAASSYVGCDVNFFSFVKSTYVYMRERIARHGAIRFFQGELRLRLEEKGWLGLVGLDFSM